MKRSILTILLGLAIWFLLVAQWGGSKPWGIYPWASGKWGILDVSDEAASTWDGNPYDYDNIAALFVCDSAIHGWEAEGDNWDIANQTSAEMVYRWFSRFHGTTYGDSSYYFKQSALSGSEFRHFWKDDTLGDPAARVICVNANDIGDGLTLDWGTFQDGDGTIVIVFRATEGQPASTAYLLSGNDFDDDVYRSHVSIRVTDEGELYNRVTYGGTDSDVYFATGASVLPSGANPAYMIALTFDSTGYQRAYRNGVLVDSADVTSINWNFSAYNDTSEVQLACLGNSRYGNRAHSGTEWIGSRVFYIAIFDDALDQIPHETYDSDLDAHLRWVNERYGQYFFEGDPELAWAQLMLDSYTGIHGEFTNATSSTEFKNYFIAGSWLFNNYYPADTCDFVLCFEFDGDLEGNTWALDGDSTLYWYCDGSLIDSTKNMPTHDASGTNNLLLVTPYDAGTGFGKLRTVNVDDLNMDGLFPDLVAAGADSVTGISMQNMPWVKCSTERLGKNVYLRSLYTTGAVYNLTGDWRDIWGCDELIVCYLNGCDNTTADICSLAVELPNCTQFSASYVTAYTGSYTLMDGSSGYTVWRCRGAGTTGRLDYLTGNAATMTTLWATADSCSLAYFSEFDNLNAWSGTIPTFVGDMDTQFPIGMVTVNVGGLSGGGAANSGLKGTTRGIVARVTGMYHFEAEGRDSITGDVIYFRTDSMKAVSENASHPGIKDVLRLSGTGVSGDGADLTANGDFAAGEWQLDRCPGIVWTDLTLPDSTYPNPTYPTLWRWWLFFSGCDYDEAQVNLLIDTLYAEIVDRKKPISIGGDPDRFRIDLHSDRNTWKDPVDTLWNATPDSAHIAKLYALADSCLRYLNPTTYPSSLPNDILFRYTDFDHDSCGYTNGVYSATNAALGIVRIETLTDRPRWE